MDILGASGSEAFFVFVTVNFVKDWFMVASYSGAFSILSYCRVCENPFYGVFMFG